MSHHTITIDEKEDIKHITKVLRLKEDDKLEISDTEQYEYVGKIKEILSDRVELDIIEKNVFQREPKCKISLYQSIPKQSKMEYIIQKCVELGISDVVPVFTKRTVVQDKGNFHKKVDRWQKIAMEAAKQSKRGIIPQVKNPLSFKEMLSDIKEKDLILFLYENEKDISIKQVLRKQMDAQSIAIIVGPEGGFSDEEVEQACANGAHSVSLGKTILRTETAGAACVAVVLYELEG
ncbi:MAG: 16S rRNA (uracil(1498)-N(3))-methyltransferase [Clostridia bacterium]|nr:16S rRNA (uracil(1498)-N(3))-methyltransferase [Clostridia bacterium]